MLRTISALVARRHSAWAAFALLALALLALAPLTAVAQAPHPAPIPPAPILLQWPEPAFDPAIQCHGQYSIAELQRFLPAARVALELPGTNRVAVDEPGHCIRMDVVDPNSGRQADQVIGGVGVPRRAVLLEVTGPQPRPAADSTRGRSN